MNLRLGKKIYVKINSKLLLGPAKVNKVKIFSGPCYMIKRLGPGRRKRGRPRRRWMDLAREDMERVGAKEGDEVDREKWKILSRCGDPE